VVFSSQSLEFLSQIPETIPDLFIFSQEWARLKLINATIFFILLIFQGCTSTPSNYFKLGQNEYQKQAYSAALAHFQTHLAQKDAIDRELAEQAIKETKSQLARALMVEANALPSQEIVSALQKLQEALSYAQDETLRWLITTRLKVKQGQQKRLAELERQAENHLRTNQRGKLTPVLQAMRKILGDESLQVLAIEKAADLGAESHRAAQLGDWRQAYALLKEIKWQNLNLAYYQLHFPKVKERLFQQEMQLAQKLSASLKIRDLWSALDHYRFILEQGEMAGDDRQNFQKKFLQQKKALALALIHRSAELALVGAAERPSALIYQLLKMGFALDPATAKKEEKLALASFQEIQAKRQLKIAIVLNQHTASRPLENFLIEELIQSKRDENAQQQLHFGVLSSSAHQELIKAMQKESGANAHKVKAIAHAIKRNPELARELAAYDLVLWGDVKTYTALETGRNNLAVKSSEFVSGTRIIANQVDAFDAREDSPFALGGRGEGIDIERASGGGQVDHLMLQQLRKLEGTCTRIKNSLARSICEGALLASEIFQQVESARRPQAAPRYTPPPATVFAEKDLTPYSYRQSHIQVKIEQRLQYQLFDLKSLRSFPARAEEVEIIFDKGGELYQGVSIADAHGLKNGEVDVPDIEDEKMRAHRRLAKKWSQAFAPHLSQQRFARFCHWGEKLLSQGSKKSLEAAENFQLCLNFSRGDGSNLYTLAQKTIHQFLQVSGQELLSFNHPSLPQTDQNSDIKNSEIKSSEIKNESIFLQPTLAEFP
jgi:hypothetical protein